MPVMQRYGYTGTVFVIGEMVGKTTRWRDAEGWLPQLPLMDWRQIRELHRLGFEVGAHSLSHHYLTALDDQQLCDEVKGAKLFLEDELAAEVAIFAYPYGDYDERVIDELIRAGYRGACATIPTRLRMTDCLFVLPRLFIARDTSPAILRALLSPGAAVGFRVLSALRRRSRGGKPWYVPDSACTDSTGTVAPIPSIVERVT
jgi:peptidoglycan/xylan/chitin deacetylase (PgdA/CDA1 family)